MKNLDDNIQVILSRIFSTIEKREDIIIKPQF